MRVKTKKIPGCCEGLDICRNIVKGKRGLPRGLIIKHCKKGLKAMRPITAGRRGLKDRK